MDTYNEAKVEANSDGDGIRNGDRSMFNFTKVTKKSKNHKSLSYHARTIKALKKKRKDGRGMERKYTSSSN